MARAVVMLNLAHMRENMLRGRNVMDITGKTALVTGANRGLGRHLAQQLRDRGAKVYAGARNPQSVDLEGVTPIALDITDPTSVATAADAAGDVSILINNAGISTGTSLLTGDLANIRLEFDTSFFGTLSVIRAFAPQLGAHQRRHVLKSSRASPDHSPGGRLLRRQVGGVVADQRAAPGTRPPGDASLRAARRLHGHQLGPRIAAPEADPADMPASPHSRHTSSSPRGQVRPGPPIRRRRRAIPAAPGFAWLSPRARGQVSPKAAVGWSAAC